MKAADVMVTNVITVEPETSVRDVAQRLLEHRISAMPVVDTDGKLVGIISEGDLMRRAEAATGRHRSWWLSLLAENESLAADYVKEHARKVSDVMTRKVIVATPETPLQKIANLLESNSIKRLPIVKDGKLVGIVSRANLLQAVASLGQEITATTPASDSVIRQNVIARLNAEPWTKPALINVIVQNGTVELWGIVDSQTEKKAIRVAAEVTPGVRVVNNNLMVRSAYGSL